MTSSSLSEWLEVLLGEDAALVGVEDVAVAVPSSGLSIRAGDGASPGAILDALPADVAASERRWHLDLLPRPILGAGEIVEALVTVGAHQYSEFRLVGASLCRAERSESGRGGGDPEAPRPSSGLRASALRSRLAPSPLRSPAAAAASRSPTARTLSWVAVPSSRSQVFTSRSLTLRQKRSLASLLSAMQALLPPPIDQEAREDDLALAAREARRSEAAARPFLEVAREQGADDALARTVWHGVLLRDGDVSRAGSFGEGLDALELLRSSAMRLAAYGAGTQLVPAYGTSDLPQGFCRAAAVKGALQALRTGIRSVTIEERTVEVEAKEDEEEGETRLEGKSPEKGADGGEVQRGSSPNAGDEDGGEAQRGTDLNVGDANNDAPDARDGRELTSADAADGAAGRQTDVGAIDRSPKSKGPPALRAVASHATVRLEAPADDAYGPLLPSELTCGAVIGAGALLRRLVTGAPSLAFPAPASALHVLVALLRAPPLESLALSSTDEVAALVAPSADGPPVRGLALGRASGTCPEGRGVLVLWARAARGENEEAVASRLRATLDGIVGEELRGEAAAAPEGAAQGETGAQEGAAQDGTGAREGAAKDGTGAREGATGTRTASGRLSSGEAGAAATSLAGDSLSAPSAPSASTSHRPLPYVLLTASYSLPLNPSRLAAPHVAECEGPSASATADDAAQDARRLFDALFRADGADGAYPLDRTPPPPEDEVSDDEALSALDRALRAVAGQDDPGKKDTSGEATQGEGDE